MDMPPWHEGHVVRKLMEARTPELKRTELARKAKVRPMTVTNLLKGGRFENETLEKICDALDVEPAAVYAEVSRSNSARSNVVPLPVGLSVADQQRRRASDRDLDTQEAEQFARRVLRLAVSAQTVIYNAIRAFEEAYGYLKPRNDHQ